MTPAPGATCVVVLPQHRATAAEIARLCGRREVALADLPAEPWALGAEALVAFCDQQDDDALAETTEAALRGVDIVLVVDGAPPARWLDTLGRAAIVIDWCDAPHQQLRPLDVCLVQRLRCGDTVAEAAVACQVSERTASRRLKAVRTLLGTRSNAEAMIALEAGVRPWCTPRR